MADALAILYERLFDLYAAVRQYMKGFGGPREDLMAEVDSAHQEFWTFILSKRCYIPPELFRRIQELGSQLKDVAETDARQALHRRETGESPDERPSIKTWAEMQEWIPAFFDDLVASIQKQLGVSEQVSSDDPVKTEGTA